MRNPPTARIAARHGFGTCALALVALALTISAVGPGQTRAQGGSAPTASASVVGGNDANAGKFPWLVSITANGAQFCGGVLIHPMIFLTAAHCLVNGEGEYFDDLPGFKFRAFVGQTRFGIGGKELDWKVDRIAPNYDLETNRNDWGIVTLDSPATAATIKLAGPDESRLWRTGRHATIAGFGDLNENGSPATTLQRLDLPILADSSCANYGAGFDRQTMLCAGFREGRKDACAGDSGGPLTVRTDGGQRRLVGLVSWGTGCAKAGFPGIYTRVADPDMSFAIEQAVRHVEQVDGFPANYSRVDVTGSGGIPHGCAAARRSGNEAARRVRSLRGKQRAARRAGNRVRVAATSRKLKKANHRLDLLRTRARKACT